LDNECGKYFHNWIKPYNGSYGSGSLDINRFFPALGNHDWYHLDSSKIYEDYFDLHLTVHPQVTSGTTILFGKIFISLCFQLTVMV